MVSNLKKSFDTRVTQDELSKSFIDYCETKMPASQGIMFEDVYIDDSWNISPKDPENNCYFRLPYKYNITQDDITLPAMTLKDYARKLNTFIQSFYYKNDGYFTLKLAMLHMAFRGLNSGKIIFEVGNGGDGKGMEAILDKNV